MTPSRLAPVHLQRMAASRSSPLQIDDLVHGMVADMNLSTFWNTQKAGMQPVTHRLFWMCPQGAALSWMGVPLWSTFRCQLDTEVSSTWAACLSL